MELIRVLLLCAFLAGCGGGGSPSAPLVVGLRGDSLTEGVYVQPDGSAGYLACNTACYLRAQGFTVVDHSKGAATVREELGLPNLYGMPPGRLDAFPGAEPVLMVRYGVADAAGRGETPEAFAANLDTLLSRVGAGQRVLLVGMDREPAYDAVIQRAAAARGLRFLSLMDIPTQRLPDGIHNDQATANAHNARIAEALRGF